MSVKQIVMAAAGAVSAKSYVDDVFATTLYTGTGSSQTIQNGIDLAGKGGMVWTKARNVGFMGMSIFDSGRGLPSSTQDIISFNANGFSLGTNGTLNANPGTSNAMVAFSFRRAARFFDVVTYTGNGASNRSIAHGLGVVPGFLLIDRVDAQANRMALARNDDSSTSFWDGVTASAFTNAVRSGSNSSSNFYSSTTFQVGSAWASGSNINSATYVAYLFAHDGDAGGLIQCGSYTGNGSATGPTVTLDWEPQWLMIKRATGGTGNWNIFDNMRGMTVGGGDAYFLANTSDTEALADFVTPTSTGFLISSADTQVNGNSNTYIYVAIRRPNKPPTAGTQVFQPVTYTGNNADNRLVNTTIAPDMVWARQRNDTAVGGMVVGDRLRGQPYLLTGATAAEVTTADAFDRQIVGVPEYGTAFSAMDGFYVGNDATAKLNVNTSFNNHVALAFKRAAGFFDVVCYTGTGSPATIQHSLGAVPELAFIKGRNAVSAWAVGANPNGLNGFSGSIRGTLNAGDTFFSNTGTFDPGTSSSVRVYQSDDIVNGRNYVMYLFASLPGICKVGTYTGNGGAFGTDGGSQTINCGFSAGSRFVLIRSITGSTTEWRIFDTARGIVTANDRVLRLESTAAETSNIDLIDPDNSGFIVNQQLGTNINVTGATYLYLAIA